MRLQTRTALLVEAIYKWNIETGTSKKYIAHDIIVAIRAADIYEALEVYDVVFNETGDIFKDAPRFYEKLFRWLGELDIKQQPDKLWFVEHLIVQAMPPNIRTDYLNRVYSDSGVSVTTSIIGSDGTVSIEALLKGLIKEHSDIQQAVVELPRCNDIGQLKEIRREASEAIAITQSAYEVVDQKIAEIEQATKAV